MCGVPGHWGSAVDLIHKLNEENGKILFFVCYLNFWVVFVCENDVRNSWGNPIPPEIQLFWIIIV